MKPLFTTKNLLFTHVNQLLTHVDPLLTHVDPLLTNYYKPHVVPHLLGCWPAPVLRTANASEFIVRSQGSLGSSRWTDWRFPKLGPTPSHHPFLDGIFHGKRNYFGVPTLMETTIWVHPNGGFHQWDIQNGWFISQKIRPGNGWWLGVALFQETYK